jgi:hypothetical protein
MWHNQPMDTRSRYQELKEQVHLHNYRYHVLDAPLVSDLEYDRLLKASRPTIPTGSHPIPPPSAPARRPWTNSRRSATRPRSCPCPTPLALRMPVPGSGASKNWTIGLPPPNSPSNPRSTASPSCCTTVRVSSSREPPAGTEKWARTSPPTCARLAPSR